MPALRSTKEENNEAPLFSKKQAFSFKKKLGIFIFILVEIYLIFALFLIVYQIRKLK